MSPIILSILALATFCTSVISGIFGMAGGMILLAALMAILPVATAIAVQGAIQIVANGSRAVFSRAFIDWRILGTICLGLFAAAVLLFLLRYTPDLATVCFAVGLMPILVWIPKHWLALDASKPLHAFFCGFLSGGLNLAVGVAGPTVDIFFIRTEMDRRTVIATKAATQVISHGAKVVFYGTAASAMAPGDWLIVAVAAPFAVLGTNVGYHVLQRLSDQNFRTWTRWIVTVIGFFYLIRGVMVLAAGGGQGRHPPLRRHCRLVPAIHSRSCMDQRDEPGGDDQGQSRTSSISSGASGGVLGPRSRLRTGKCRKNPAIPFDLGAIALYGAVSWLHSTASPRASSCFWLKPARSAVLPSAKALPPRPSAGGFPISRRGSASCSSTDRPRG